MNKLSANTILPLIAALPDSEKAVLADKLNEILTKPEPDGDKPPKGYENLPKKFWPNNKEMLIYDILYNSSS